MRTAPRCSAESCEMRREYCSAMLTDAGNKTEIVPCDGATEEDRDRAHQRDGTEEVA